MSRKPSFANLRTTVGATTTTSSIATSNPESEERVSSASNRPASREGRKQIAGFFAPDMSFAMHMLARRQDRSLQALMTEAFNDVLRKYGESPMGE